MIQYITGFSPAIGCTLSSDIVTLAKKDPAIANERETVDFHSSRSQTLYRMQCDAYKEMTHALALTGDSTQTTKYHVSDVFLDDGFMMRPTTQGIKSDIICGCPGSVLSFSKKENHFYFPVEPFLKVLQKCSNLITLKVWYASLKTDPDLLSVIPQLENLQNVSYTHLGSISEDERKKKERKDFDSHIVRAFLQLPRLKFMQL